jgi:hypothetical protein
MAKTSMKAIGIGAAVAVIVAALALAFGISIVFAIPVWLLWNWLMPMIFGLTKLTLWQAWGVTFLSALLFKSGSGTVSSGK